MEPDRRLAETTGDGGAEAVGEELLSALNAELAFIRSDIGNAVLSERMVNAETRFCRWDGQSDDGRKRKASLGKDAFPFEGASDTRPHLVDKIINERVQEYVTAAVRGQPTIHGKKAGVLNHLLRWLVRSLWGADFRSELELVAQWMEGDTPAVAVLGVWWKRELALESRTVTAEDVLRAYAEQMQQTQESEEVQAALMEDLADIVMSPARTDDFEALLTGLYPDFDRKRIKAAVREMTLKGETELPMPYVRVNAPEFEALRAFEDVFFRSNVKKIQDAGVVFVRRWLDRAQVLENAAREQWAPGFVKELLGEGDTGGKVGLSSFDTDQTSESDSISRVTTGMTEARDGLYEVLWAYTRMANRDGRLGIYVTVMSGLCPTAATKRTLLNYDHGQMPFVEFRREKLTRRLVDSRSVSELLMTHQNSIKLVADSIEDHVQVTTNPPLKKPRGSPKYQLMLTPFGEIEEVNARQPIEFLKRPEYPRAAMDHRQNQVLDVDDMTGRENGGLPTSRSTMARQYRVDNFLGCLGQAEVQALQLCQQWMTDEDMERVSGVGWESRTVQEIQGKFDLQLSFDVRDMDNEYLQKKGELLLRYIRPLDSRGELPWNDIARSMLQVIDPNMADMMPAPEAVQKRILDDEDNVFLKNLGGVESEMAELVEAPELRLEQLQKRLQPRMENPQAFEQMSPAAQALIENRMKYLQQQASQAQNAVIGRIGAKPVDLGQVNAETLKG